MTESAKGLANHEVVTIAVFMLHGDVQAVDTEDIAIKAAEIAPGRFAWRKYPEQINLDAVRKRLWDACRPDKGGYLIGSEKDGWHLTDAGVQFASTNAPRLTTAESRRPLSLREKRWYSREREHMLGSIAYEKFVTGQMDSITAKEAADFFRVDDYVAGVARKRRLDRLSNAFRDDSDLGPLVQALAARVRED